MLLKKKIPELIGLLSYYKERISSIQYMIDTETSKSTIKKLQDEQDTIFNEKLKVDKELRKLEDIYNEYSKNKYKKN